MLLLGKLIVQYGESGINTQKYGKNGINMVKLGYIPSGNLNFSFQVPFVILLLPHIIFNRTV